MDEAADKAKGKSASTAARNRVLQKWMNEPGKVEVAKGSFADPAARMRKG